MASNFQGVGHDFVETVDKGHGRIDHRRAWVVNDEVVMNWINTQHKWPGLAATGMVQVERRIGRKLEVESRYYWVLDTAFMEDESRIRAGYAAENLASLRHMALNLLKKHLSKKGSSIRTRRLRAGWHANYLRRLLTDNDEDQ